MINCSFNFYFFLKEDKVNIQEREKQIKLEYFCNFLYLFKKKKRKTRIEFKKLVLHGSGWGARIIL